MTNQEAIKWVEERMCHGRYTPTKNNPLVIDDCFKAGEMAIEALEQEPCEDAVDRKYLLETLCMACRRPKCSFRDKGFVNFRCYPRCLIEDSPSVQPQTVDWDGMIEEIEKKKEVYAPESEDVEDLPIDYGTRRGLSIAIKVINKHRKDKG